MSGKLSWGVVEHAMLNDQTPLITGADLWRQTKGQDTDGSHSSKRKQNPLDFWQLYTFEKKIEWPRKTIWFDETWGL